MPDFTPAAKPSKRRTATFTIEGNVLTARQPKAYAMLDLADLADLDLDNPVNAPKIMRAVESFLNDCLDANSRAYIQGRLYDPDDDDFDVDALVPILHWLSEEFTKRPTTPPSASSATRVKTGRGSTGRARSTASTPAASAPTGS